MKKYINAKEYIVEDIITKVIIFVNKTRLLNTEAKIHAIKSILYKEYNIDVAYAVLEKRLINHGE